MKIYLLSLLVILTLGGSIVGWIYLSDTSDKDTLPPPNEGDNITTYDEQKNLKQKEVEKDTELYNAAINKKDSTLCQSIKDPKKQTECKDMLIAIQALQKEDINLCLSITDPKVLIQCKDRLILQGAKKKGDSGLCAPISSPEDQLYCRESIDEIRLQKALQDRTITADFCQSLEVKFQEACTASLVQKETQNVYNSSIRDGNTDGCDLIPIESEKLLCFDTITLRRAIADSNLSLCNTLHQEDKKSYCTSTLTRKNEIQLFREYIASNNLVGCQKLTETTLKNKCNDTILLSLVRINKTPILCRNITNSGMVANCLKLSEQ